MKLLKEKYKTYEGARKRAAFENGVALSEYKHGTMRHVYRYSVIAEDNLWRVRRERAEVSQ